MRLIIVAFLGLFIFEGCKGHHKEIQKIDKKAMQEYKQEAVSLIKKVGGQLKPQLKEAMGKGLVEAVDFCVEKSPKIMTEANKGSEWEIKRVSLKNRNPHAKPDAWEEKVLKIFDKRAANGEKIQKMSYSEVVGDDFRFMKAQGTKGVCLTCHSSSVDSSILNAIKKHYPNDKAIGYKLGDVRGAFSLSKKISSK